MVYSPNKVVACVKVNGKILREDKNVVTLPFGSEYSVFIKNLNPVRIKVRVSVDGTDATEGCWLIVEPNSNLDLERFIKNGNMDRGNRFKFIERTKEIEEGPRGIKSDDGLIRIEYQVEVVKPKPIVVEEHHHHHHHDHWDFPVYPKPYDPWYPYGRPRWESNLTKSSTPLRSNSLRPSASSGEKSVESFRSFVSDAAQDFSLSDDSVVVAGAGPINDQGITVPGSESNQSFRWVSGFETGASEVIVLQLRGKIAEQPVVKAVLVETKLTCVTCGKTSKSTEKFCSKCGTALEIL